MYKLILFDGNFFLIKMFMNIFVQFNHMSMRCHFFVCMLYAFDLINSIKL